MLMTLPWAKVCTCKLPVLVIQSKVVIPQCICRLVPEAGISPEVVLFCTVSTPTTPHRKHQRFVPLHTGPHCAKPEAVTQLSRWTPSPTTLDRVHCTLCPYVESLFPKHSKLYNSELVVMQHATVLPLLVTSWRSVILGTTSRN